MGLAARTSHCVPRRAFLSPLPIGISSPRCHSPSFASLCTKGSNFSTRLQATRHLATSVKPKEPPPAPQERRPLAASPYDSEFSPRSSSERSEELLNLPNILTASRIASTPFLGYLIITDRLAAAVGLLFAAAVTDLLDGWLARKWNKFTVFGSIADPAADKLLMTVMVVTLGYRGFLPRTLREPTLDETSQTSPSMLTFPISTHSSRQLPSPRSSSSVTSVSSASPLSSAIAPSLLPSHGHAIGTRVFPLLK